MKKIKKILVVGGAGYIGSYVNKFLNQIGYETVILDNLSTGDQRTVVCGDFIYGDLKDLTTLDHLFSSYKIDAVMHFAALIDSGESVYKPAEYYENNVIHSLNLLKIMLKHQVKNFVFSSSAAVYGFSTSDHLDENQPKLPINPYGQTKNIIEHALDDYHKAYNFNSTSLRYFNAAGGDPEGIILNYRTSPSNLIPISLKSVILNQAITIYGTDYPTPDGTCIRDYIHIHDLAVAHTLALEQLFRQGGCTCYNLGNGRGFSVKEVLEAVERTVKIKLNIKEGPRRPGDPPILVANANFAREKLGWTPSYPTLDDIIHDAWRATSHQLCRLA